MTYRTSREKTLKIMQFGFVRPASGSDYSLNSIVKYSTMITENDPTVDTRHYYGNLTGLTLSTHTNTNDTLVLPAGRYFIQAKLPVVEGYKHSNMNNLGFVEWQNFTASSLTGTYSSFGTKGRNNPGRNVNDAGDDAGVHTYAAGIIDSNSTVYLQTRIVTNSNYSTINTSGSWSIENKILIWRAD